MPQMNMVQAINDALRFEMRRDSRVLLMGEDVGKVGGVFRVTAGLHEEFGDDRGIDTPLSEGGIIGAAIGMALYGLVPVPEIQFGDFIFPAYDQIVSELAKYRYRSGGEYPAKMVIRTPVGGGIRGGHYHSQSPEAQFIHVAGLKVVCPATPADAKGLLLSSIRDPDPVLFFEPKRVYRAAKGEVPEGDYTVPLGKASIMREGDKVTVIAWGAMLYEALDAAQKASEQGVECEVLDLRTLWPLEREEDRSRRRRARGAEELRARRGDRLAHQREGLPPPRGAAEARHRLRHAVPLHARERIPPALPPHPPGRPRDRPVLRGQSR
jgi:2-oxoisovalerate dehydrogenase E1 component beta subunit